MVTGLSELIGGPAGRHLPRQRRFWTPLRCLLAVAIAACVLGYAQKAPCRSHPWAGEYQYTRGCYTDVFALYYSEGLVDGQVPYADHAVEYPVVIGGAMLLAATVARAFPVDERPQRFLDITALLLTICALLVVWTTVRLAGPGRQWDAAMVAVAPVLILHAFTNWDLIAVACTGLALYAWARGRVGWAGVAVGIGVATKLYPLLLLVALLPLCLRARRLREWGIAAGAATFAWAVVDLPVWVAYPAAFGRFYSGNRLRPADWDSLWFALQHLIGHPLDSGAGVPNVLNIAVAATFVAGLAFVGWLTLAAPRRPRVAQVAFLVVLTFLLANKVFSPQYSLWLLPLAVLARPRWGMFLLWQASEVFLLFTRFYFFVGVDHSGQGLPAVVFLCAVLARDAVLVTLAWLVAREMWHPERDVVRRHAVDDPAGGPVEGAADTRFGLPWRALSRDGSAG